MGPFPHSMKDNWVFSILSNRQSDLFHTQWKTTGSFSYSVTDNQTFSILNERQLGLFHTQWKTTGSFPYSMKDNWVFFIFNERQLGLFHTQWKTTGSFSYSIKDHLNFFSFSISMHGPVVPNPKPRTLELGGPWQAHRLLSHRSQALPLLQTHPSAVAAAAYR